jgi:hypothetical protein
MQSAYSLNGVTIKRPSNFKIERFNITKATRLASGLMDMQLVARKRKFYFTWSAIRASDLNVILDIIWESQDVFFTLDYIENNEHKTAIVYSGSIPSTLHHTDVVDWVWEDVQIDFIEQ